MVVSGYFSCLNRRLAALRSAPAAKPPVVCKSTYFLSYNRWLGSFFYFFLQLAPAVHSSAACVTYVRFKLSEGQCSWQNGRTARKAQKFGVFVNILVINRICIIACSFGFSRVAKGHLLPCERPPFAMQKATSCMMKGLLLQSLTLLFRCV